MSWASAEMQTIWEPRLSAIANAWMRVEIDSVGPVRDCGLVFCSPERIAQQKNPYTMVAKGRYAIAATPTLLCAFIAAWNAHDDVKIGGLLGFPTCCQKFFHTVWNVENKRDTTLQMLGDISKRHDYSNILGRWAGVRFVPHLPCSWQCEATITSAQSLLPLWAEQELTWAAEWASWPTRYSALHGLAIITNPVCRIVAGTDYTPDERRLDSPGSAYPEGAPSGLTFPFEKPTFVSLTSLASFKNSVDQSAGLWSENGFSSFGAMHSAHDMIMRTLAMRSPSVDDCVVDLGAGNGELLKRIRSTYQCDVLGIEVDKNKIRADFLEHGDLTELSLFDHLPRARFIIVSRRRFEEIPGLIKRCLLHAENVLAYSYDNPRGAEFLCS